MIIHTREKKPINTKIQFAKGFAEIMQIFVRDAYAKQAVILLNKNYLRVKRA